MPKRVAQYVAFDAAHKCGMATRADKIYSCTFDASDHAEVSASVAIAQGKKVAVIEDCYLGKNVATMKSLAVIQGRLTQACESVGMRVVTVPASTWQAAYGITGSRTERKRGAMRVAKMIGGDPKNQDEADAICLLDYAECNRI